MPRRTDLRRICLLGSGPIVIGQACEFDYSGTQAIRALREEGYEVILVNSNPATIMTDPDVATRTYIEPLTAEYVEDILRKEKPDALLPTMGGQTALNLAMDLHKRGVLEELGIELIGAGPEAIELAENRESFKGVLDRCGVEYARSGYAKSLEQAVEFSKMTGFPCVLRPSFTLGGTGACFVWKAEDFEAEAKKALALSPVHEVLVEESLLGWKEYELEVVRDKKDNVIIVCSIENLDPMGVHTGDSITVAPQMTLTDVEYQKMRDASIRILREVGVETGGSNVQFAVNPETGRQIAIEMNPRVSRSSALASKATGFPIARIAAKLAVGYTLDELPNDITKTTPSSFEPSLDYVVVKIPRFAFEKFPNSDSTLSPAMKSVGEAMAMGSNFTEALQKALRSLETKLWGLNPIEDRRRLKRGPGDFAVGICAYLEKAKPDRLLWVAQAFREEVSVERVYAITKIDRWFLKEIEGLIEMERAMVGTRGGAATPDALRSWKEAGFSDAAIAYWSGTTVDTVVANRKKAGLEPGYRIVDTCAAEFASRTPYYYSTYWGAGDDLPIPKKGPVVILGGGPNRIGQGIEFDYCCVQASLALREEGIDSVMINCNPETVSTDFDVSDRLYFEPLFPDDLLPIFEREQPRGTILHFGGQTPLNLAKWMKTKSIPILGTSGEAIALAEDRELFRALCNKLGVEQPESLTVDDRDDATAAARQLGFPLLARPSFVLGGGGMAILYNERDFQRWLLRGHEISAEAPLLLDRFLQNAIEVDVDAIHDGEETLLCGMMEQVQEAGVHSGDSASLLPPSTLSAATQKELYRLTDVVARGLGVRGLVNVQFAIVPNGGPDGKDRVFVLEVNPRASRTVPFVSKAAGIPYVRIATKVMLGRKLSELKIPAVTHRLVFAKESVFPFRRFPETDPILGPEMRSTGEVMGVGRTVAEAFAKAQIGAGMKLPKAGTAFLSVRDGDKDGLAEVCAQLIAAKFHLIATRGTAEFLRSKGFLVETVNKVQEGRPHAADRMREGKVDLVVNTSTLGRQEAGAAYELRAAALANGICYFTTLTAARAAAGAILELQRVPVVTHCVQDFGL